MILAIIPARGGSKRIPRKNIKPFFGKPIIAWSIETARQSNLFHKVIVSTDDAEIAAIAKIYGAEVPFMRPPELSDDYTTTNQVIKHAIETLEAQGMVFDYVCCIYPTAPFIHVNDLLKGYENLTKNHEAHFSFPVCEFPYPIQRALTYKHGKLTMFQPAYFPSRSQDLEPAFHDAGQFYWGKKKAYMSDFSTFAEHTIPIFIPRTRVIDLDTPEDWELATLMARYLFPENLSFR